MRNAQCTTRHHSNSRNRRASGSETAAWALDPDFSGRARWGFYLLLLYYTTVLVKAFIFYLLLLVL
jgi:hypothetical protein